MNYIIHITLYLCLLDNNVGDMTYIDYELDLKSDYPTDRGQFHETVTDALKRIILQLLKLNWYY